MFERPLSVQVQCQSTLKLYDFYHIILNYKSIHINYEKWHHKGSSLGCSRSSSSFIVYMVKRNGVVNCFNIWCKCRFPQGIFHKKGGRNAIKILHIELPRRSVEESHRNPLFNGSITSWAVVY